MGFNPDLTARDNVVINAIMLGLSRKQAEARFDDIVAFAELEEFMDLKLKNYSSGMQVRLAFAVAIQVDAEIVLIDEVLAVGDASFQQKCFDEFQRLKTEGRTIVFVSHDMGSVERFCDRAMLMERGRVVEIGESSKVARRYNEMNFRRVREQAREEGGPDTLRRAPVAELVSAFFEAPEGGAQVSIPQGEACCVRLDVRFHDNAENPIFSVALRNELGNTAFATGTQLENELTGTFHAGDSATVRVRLRQLARSRSLSPHGRGDPRRARGRRLRHAGGHQLDHRQREPLGRRHRRSPPHDRRRTRGVRRSWPVRRRAPPPVGRPISSLDGPEYGRAELRVSGQGQQRALHVAGQRAAGTDRGAGHPRSRLRA